MIPAIGQKYVVLPGAHAVGTSTRFSRANKYVGETVEVKETYPFLRSVFVMSPSSGEVFAVAENFLQPVGVK